MKLAAVGKERSDLLPPLLILVEAVDRLLKVVAPAELGRRHLNNFEYLRGLHINVFHSLANRFHACG